MNQATDLKHSPGPVEEGNPADDFRAFRRALGVIPRDVVNSVA